MNSQVLQTGELGSLRIYMTARTQLGSSLWGKLFGKRLYRQIIDEAKSDNLLNANAHSSLYGFSNRGKILVVVEHPGLAGTIYVELIDTRSKLESFCHKHRELLKDKLMVYQALEQWNFPENITASTPTDGPQD